MGDPSRWPSRAATRVCPFASATAKASTSPRRASRPLTTAGSAARACGLTGASFGWLQGTSMSSPNATGVAALTLGAHPGLSPDALLARLQATARTDMANGTGPNKPADFGVDANGVPCTSGYCHLQYYTPGDPANPITFADAYGAGMVNAAAAAA